MCGSHMQNRNRASTLRMLNHPPQTGDEKLALPGIRYQIRHMIKERGHLTCIRCTWMLRHIKFVYLKPPVETLDNTSRTGLIACRLSNLLMPMLYPPFGCGSWLPFPFWRELVRRHQVFERLHIHHALIWRSAKITYLVTLDDVDKAFQKMSCHICINIGKFRLIAIFNHREIFEQGLRIAVAFQPVGISKPRIGVVHAFKMSLFKSPRPFWEILNGCFAATVAVF